MVAGYFGSQREFRCGWSLLEDLKRNILPEEQAIEFMKLSLFAEDETKNIAEKIEQCLQSAGRTRVDLMTDHLQAIWQDIITAARRQTSPSNINIDGLQHELVLSGSLGWNPEVNRFYSDALQAAALPVAKYFIDPVNTVVRILDTVDTGVGSMELVDLWRNGEGKIVQVVDLGGGTCVGSVLTPTSLTVTDSVAGHDQLPCEPDRRYWHW